MDRDRYKLSQLRVRELAKPGNIGNIGFGKWTNGVISKQLQAAYAQMRPLDHIIFQPSGTQ